MLENSGVREEFVRNIGLLNEEEQARIERSRVAVAGAGGVGGVHLLTLARLGVGKFSIADPDIFEPVNINRQFGAMASTCGRNKSQVLEEMIRDINPRAEISVFQEGVSGDNVASFLEGVDVFIDGIDFFEIDVRRLLFKTARRMNIHAMTAAPLGFGATLQVFAPDGMTFDSYFGISDAMGYEEKLAAFASSLAPYPYHLRYLDLSKVDLKAKRGPALSLSCTLCASLAAAETVKILTGKGKVKAVPHYVQMDLLLGKCKRGYLLFGGSNPLMKIKKRLILRKMNL